MSMDPDSSFITISMDDFNLGLIAKVEKKDLKRKTEGPLKL